MKGNTIKMKNDNVLLESLKTARAEFGSKIPNIIFDRFTKLDWTSTYKFIYKMCELYDNGYSEQSIISLFKNYKLYESYIKGFDITTAKFGDIESVIENAKTTKFQSRSYIENKLKHKSLVYSRDNYRLYNVHNFSEMMYVSKSTPWCIGLNEEEYIIYSENYSIYVLCDYSEIEASIYRKICIMLSKKGGVDMIVTMDNVHHYSNSDNYKDIITKHIPKEIADLLML